MRPIISHLPKYLRRILFKLDVLILSKQIKVEPYDTEYIGSDYGGWFVPRNLLSKDSICYLVGVGEDISFDLELIKKYELKAYLFDPTPKSKLHIESLTNKMDHQTELTYDAQGLSIKIKKEDLNNLEFIPEGLWNVTSEVKFFAPKDANHVSHSIVNLQRTEDYFVAKVDRLKNFMTRNKHVNLDLLKLDIEGAEYSVIEDIVKSRLNIKSICVEFDEANNPIDRNFASRIKKACELLSLSGYKIIHITNKLNITFLHQNHIS